MTKDQRNAVTEYIGSLSDDMLGTLTAKLTDRIDTDLAEALDFMGRNNRMDSLLGTASSAFQLYDLSDQIRDIMSKECRRRGVSPGACFRN